MDGRFKREPEQIEIPDKAKYMRVSDLIPLANSVGYQRKQMVALIAALNEIADWKKMYENLAEIYCLDIVFDLC